MPSDKSNKLGKGESEMSKYKYKLFYRCRMCEVIFEKEFESDNMEEYHFPFLSRHHGCVNAEEFSDVTVGLGDIVALDQTPYLNLKRKKDAKNN
jgi:hypothetical protein